MIADCNGFATIFPKFGAIHDAGSATVIELRAQIGPDKPGKTAPPATC